MGVFRLRDGTSSTLRGGDVLRGQYTVIYDETGLPVAIIATIGVTDVYIPVNSYQELDLLIEILATVTALDRWYNASIGVGAGVGGTGPGSAVGVTTDGAAPGVTDDGAPAGSTVVDTAVGVTDDGATPGTANGLQSPGRTA